MAKIEKAELTVLCLIHKDDEYLLQNRLKNDWKGLTIHNPKLCVIKQFPIEEGRYIVFLFRTNEFTGNVVSSDEGEMQWVHKSELENKNIVNDLPELLQVMLTDELTEFQYVIENNSWNVVIK